MWTKEGTKRLIELIKARDCLWKITDSDYRNKPKRQAAFKEISIELNMRPEEVKQKMHRMRTQFAREKQKMNSTTKAYVTKWEFFESLKEMFEQTYVKSSETDSATLPDKLENTHLADLDTTTTTTDTEQSWVSKV